MGIYDRDWYKRSPDERFKQSESDKARNENAMRDAFERFTKGFSRRRSGNRYAPPPQKQQAVSGAAYDVSIERPSTSTTVIVLFWLGLLLLLFSFFTWRSAPKVSGTPNRVELQIPAAADGHHYIDGAINGHRVSFMLDTGASYTAISESLAHRVGLPPGQVAIFETANGRANGRLVAGQVLAIGGLSVPPLTIGVMPGYRDFALLGQNFLRHVELTQSNRNVVIRGQGYPQALPWSVRVYPWTTIGGAVVLAMSLALLLLERSSAAKAMQRRQSETRKPARPPRTYRPKVIDERLLLACAGDEGLAMRLIESEIRKAPEIDELEATNRALKRLWESS